MKSNNKLVEVKNLRTYFDTAEGTIKAVDNVNFEINRGETLGVVGESGCGKSITSLSLMNLVPQPKGYIKSGTINYYAENGVVDITSLNPHSRDMRSMRGNEMAMIFQEPMTSLNPVYTIGSQIMEAVLLHQDVDKEEAREIAIEMIAKVGIPAPKQRVDEYPYELSGGMRQRAMIAMALSCNPSFLIADEPTTALDVTIEAQILDLMQDLQEEFNTAIMFITHDLDVIGEIADRIMVMYTGKVVETAPVDDIFYNPKHPYTKGLLASIPKVGRKKRLTPIEGTVPDLNQLPAGCYFAPRCPQATDKCRKKMPPTFKVDEDHSVKCWLAEEEGEESYE
ncbi:oligopeptide/dipeptide ABC transporter, ATP-binding protein [Halobacteroides halobius DSM 5150]|uniref:Oligopeptide/dipeptide ABC transporter, ATP-binding protein n=1 Tax=Halobacteroides halobius (strain ATCC 35273 / DSM 5150 / MD-1) TaxID=748449 RepID=L0KAU9_HALHC|nr:ABC transporter ATP-binding protein [Halobacteroides halobius]AGB41665.1 oligopeptide/dipeptide ABC transporter, ATP-binding protein [Halobacteroides halobius DSM 5150]